MDSDIARILEELFKVLPVIQKKLLRIDLCNVAGNLSRPHLAIMGMLEHGILPISEVARRMVAPRSQMTHLVDHLEERDIVVRMPDATDRRVIKIGLTEHGRAAFRECQERVKQNIRERLAVLSPAELADLSAALTRLGDIGAKLK